MQNSGNTMGYIWEGLVPSPIGVNHYELTTINYSEYLEIRFPSPTGVNYYEFKIETFDGGVHIQFPSPTGVNYSE